MWALTLTLGLVLILALIVRMANWGDGVIKPIVQCIKVLAILVGVGITIKNTTGRGWLWGGILGVLYTVFAFCIFSAIDGSFTVGVAALNDLVFAIIIGVISAMLFRGRRKNIEA